MEEAGVRNCHCPACRGSLPIVHLPIIQPPPTTGALSVRPPIKAAKGTHPPPDGLYYLLVPAGQAGRDAIAVEFRVLIVGGVYVG
jgi:hypothetical protein